jgi:hypothetical protein
LALKQPTVVVGGSDGMQPFGGSSSGFGGHGSSTTAVDLASLLGEEEDSVDDPMAFNDIFSAGLGGSSGIGGAF